MNKIEKIAQINEVLNRQIAEIDARREYRMKNYYDCIDDYSFGGLCDKADDWAENNCRRAAQIKIEEVENDGYHYEDVIIYGLINAVGQLVAKGTHSGQYGQYFIDDETGKCVGIPKKLSTLTKKGYRLVRFNNRYACQFKEINNHGNVINAVMIPAGSTMTVEAEIPTYIPVGIPYSEYQFETYFC